MEDRLRLKDWPDEEKPRERLLRLGASALSDAELLAILLGTGTLNETAIDLARRLLAWGQEEYGSGLSFLTEATAEEIMAHSGMGPSKVCRLKASVELARRMRKNLEGKEKPVFIRGSRDVYEYLGDELEGQDREHFCIIMLNVRNRVIGQEVISIGSLDASIAHPREIFKNCIKRSAAGVILVHNHPSGDATPSDDDLEMTQRVIKAGTVLGIYVVDHVILGKGSFYSMREHYSEWFSR